MRIAAIAHKPFFLALLLAAAAAGLYWPTLQADFVYDDRALILVSDYLHDARHFGRVLSFQVLADDVPDNCRPVYLLSMLADAALWGKFPAGYHLTNLLLHAANVFLLFFFLAHVYRIFSKEPMATGWLVGAGGAALLFAAHPAASEAVCAVTFREDLLAAFFVLLGLNLAARFPGRTPAATWLAGAGMILCFLAAAASKETGLAGAPLLTIYAGLARRREWNRAWSWLIAAAWLVAGLFLLARFAFQPATSAVFLQKPGWLGGSFAAMLQVQPRIWAYQLQLLCWPARLCADQGPFNLAHLGLGAALFVLAGAAAAVILLARRQRAVWLAAALIALPLLPVSNFVPIFRPLADRYLYFPLAGVALLVGLALQWAWLTRRYYLLALLPVLVGGLAFLTLQREAVWKNELALWCDTFIRNPRSFTAANNLGFACHQSGQYVRAVACWQRAVQLAGDREADPWAGLAIVYWRLGRREEAVRAYQRAVACNGDYARPEKLVAQLTWEPAAAAELAVVARQAERTAKSLTE